MAYSDVQINNLALGRVFADRIASLTEGSSNARAANAIYAVVRDMLIEEHDWSFARARVALALLDDAPAFGYDYKYQLPADFISIIDINADVTTIYRVEGRELLTDHEAVNLRYTKRVTDPAEFSVPFVEALWLTLAFHFAGSIAKSRGLQQEIYAELKDALPETKARNSQFDTERPAEGSTYADARA